MGTNHDMSLKKDTLPVPSETLYRKRSIETFVSFRSWSWVAGTQALGGSLPPVSGSLRSGIGGEPRRLTAPRLRRLPGLCGAHRRAAEGRKELEGGWRGSGGAGAAVGR